MIGWCRVGFRSSTNKKSRKYVNAPESPTAAADHPPVHCPRRRARRRWQFSRRLSRPSPPGCLSPDHTHLLLLHVVAAQAEFGKRRLGTGGFVHFIGSRVETRRFQATTGKTGFNNVHSPTPSRPQRFRHRTPPTTPDSSGSSCALHRHVAVQVEFESKL
jgi:hypothetical protein